MISTLRVVTAVVLTAAVIIPGLIIVTLATWWLKVADWVSELLEGY